MYVYNYYDSSITLVFETLKTVFIVVYLFYKVGSLTVIGLGMSGLFVVCTLGLTK